MFELYDILPIAISILDENDTLCYMNFMAKSFIASKQLDDEKQISNHTLFHDIDTEVSQCPICIAIAQKQTIKRLEIQDKSKRTISQFNISYLNKKDKQYTIQSICDVTKEYYARKKLTILENHMQLAMRGNKAGTWEWDMMNNQGYYSPEWKEILGYDADEHFSPSVRTWASRAHPSELTSLLKKVYQAIHKKEEKIDVVQRLKHKDGHWIWVLGRGTLVYNREGEAIRLVGMHSDITDQKLLQDKAKERGKILENSLNEIYIFDKETLKIFYINKRAKDNLGYSYEEIQQLTPIDLKPDMDKEAYRNILHELSTGKAKNKQFTLRHRRKDGTHYYADIFLQTTTYAGRDAYVSIVLDVNERMISTRKLLEQKNTFEHKANHHVLTGLPNRTLFLDLLEQSLIHANNNSTIVALLFVDIDKFKEINDNYGHTVGDAVLKICAKRLKSCARQHDTVAHMSGDEFLLILEGITHKSYVEVIADKIVRHLNEPIIVEYEKLTISVSVGVSFYPDDARNVKNLLMHSDVAMYDAKKSGKNNYKMYDTSKEARVV